MGRIVAESKHVRIEAAGEDVSGNNLYNVFNKGVLRHPNSHAEDVMRAITHYLRGLEFQIEKMEK